MYNRNYGGIDLQMTNFLFYKYLKKTREAIRESKPFLSVFRRNFQELLNRKANYNFILIFFLKNKLIFSKKDFIYIYKVNLGI